MITITAFHSVPAFAQGLVRDLRARWALEEAGLPYKVELIDASVQTSPAYRARQPFGQVPVYEDDDVSLFESGSIVLHVAQRSTELLPAEPSARARAITWVFAALNTIEPLVQQLAEIDLFNAGKEWTKGRRPEIELRIRRRLAELSAHLGEREFLEGRFTAGDLLMTTVLRILRHTPLVEEQPRLLAWKERCESRPAFRRALQGQMDGFAAAPGGATR